MALQVKKSLLQREKRILVAIEVAVRKMETLSMISTLCHHFSVASAKSSRNPDCCCWLDQVKRVLGRHAVDILEELVSCLKQIYWPMHFQMGDQDYKKTLTRDEFKQDLIGRLKHSKAKCKFLKEIITRGKLILKEGNASGCDVNNKSTKPTYSSVVNLLRAALKSKHKPHVRRCFEDLDVESLMNILSLIIRMPSTSAEQSVTSKKVLTDGRTDLSPFSSIMLKDPAMGQDIESYYYVESPVTSVGSISWDDEDTVIHLIEELQADESMHSHQRTPEGTAISEFQHESSTVIGIPKPEKIKITDVGRSFSTSSLTSKDLSCVRYSPPKEKDIVDLYHKFAYPVSMLPPDAVNSLLDGHTEDCTNQIKTGAKHGIQFLLETFHDFHTLVQAIFAQNDEMVVPGNGFDLNRLTIDLQLLAIEEHKLQKILYKDVQSHKYLQENLDKDILQWQDRVDDAHRNIAKQLQTAVESHVTAEMSIAKSRQSELSQIERTMVNVNESLSRTRGFVKQTVKSLRARRHYLEASLESLIRVYNSTMLKYQVKIDEFSVEEIANNREIEKLQNKFKNVEEKYDEMRAMKRLKQLLQNMEKAEAIKQNWAARKIQVAWRKYKVAKLRKKKLKGRKKGKKKTPPPPGKGSSPPTKSSTATPGSRSKSQTP